MTKVILFVVDFVISGFSTMYIWNAVLAPVFGVATLGFWHMWAVSFALFTFQHRKDEKTEDWNKRLVDDICYTLINVGVIALFMWLSRM